MSAKELLACINAKYPGLQTTICRLHKPCAITGKCSMASRKKVIDFDAVERLFHEGKEASTASVDAVCCDDQNLCFCFVEIKGWDEFLYNPRRKGRVSRESIEKQVAKYDLKGKLEHSMEICLSLYDGAVPLDKDAWVYVLVTDINVEEKPLESLVYNLTMLSETASSWTFVCNDLLRKDFERIEGIRKYYISCRDFDDTMMEMSL